MNPYQLGRGFLYLYNFTTQISSVEVDEIRGGGTSVLRSQLFIAEIIERDEYYLVHILKRLYKVVEGGRLRATNWKNTDITTHRL